MARGASKKDPKSIPLKKADRSGPDPTQQTLLDIAEKRGLLKAEKSKVDVAGEDDTDDPANSPGRLGESVLWSISLAMLHFTFDVLVQHQYAEEIRWSTLLVRCVQAFGGGFFNDVAFAKLS
jgi:hypothetical protein